MPSHGLSLLDCLSACAQALQPVLLPGGYDPLLERAGQAGQLGAPLLPSDVALLQLKPLRRCALQCIQA